jgi:hypothetical protein
VWLAVSLSVDLLPLFGPGSAWVFGQALFEELTGRVRREPLWLGADLTVALTLQLLAALACYWILSKPLSFRPLVALGALPLVMIGLQWLYVTAIPARFLIEAEPTPEHGQWAVDCILAGHTLVVPAPRAIVRGDPADALWVADVLGRPRPLRQPGCQLGARDVMLDDAGTTLASIAPPGRFLFEREDRKKSRREWWYGSGAGAKPVRVEQPAGHEPRDGPPVLAVDDHWVAWVVGQRESERSRPQILLVRSLRGPEETLVRLQGLPTGAVRVLDLEMRRREVTLALGERSFAGAGLDGLPRWGPLQPDGVDPLPSTFRRLGDGWVAWDGSRENEPYRLAWSLASGKGQHQVRRGRSVTAVAVHPQGRFIALSVTSARPQGGVEDAVYVLRVEDGVEVLRRFLPAKSRSQVVFLGADRLAYTHFDGVLGQVRVLRVPD